MEKLLAKDKLFSYEKRYFSVIGDQRTWLSWGYLETLQKPCIFSHKWFGQALIH